MRQSRTFMLLSVVVAVLLMAVAYAALSNVTLNVTGNVAATADQGNFKVAFTGKFTSKVASGTQTATATMTASGQTATMNVSGMKSAGDKMVIRYEIKNSSSDIGALISASVNESNTEYFSCTVTMNDYQVADGEEYPLAPDEIAELRVVVLLKRNPIDDVKGTIKINITAAPYVYS